MENPGQKDKDEATLQMARGILLSVSSARTGVDAFAKWFLTGVGALMALMIGNISTNVAMLSATGISQCLLLLIVSVLFGVLSRYKCLEADVFLAVLESQTAARKEMGILGLPEPDTDKALDLVTNSQTSLSKLVANRRFAAAKKRIREQTTDARRLAAAGKAAQAVFMQRLYAALMVAGACAFALNVAWWIRG